MRDEGWLLFRQGQKPLDTRKHEGTVAVKESDTRWCSDGLELSCDNGERVRVAFALDCCDDLPPASRTRVMAVSPQILENCGYEDHTIYR